MVQNQYPVRVSLNITQDTADVVAYIQRLTGETRGEICREAVCRGLAGMARELARRAKPR